ncbi:centrosomal protein of 192 kDa-like isoform X1 [Dreissena polymorpha]|nr:centrosomal protein of 192 kDa-like isoform X1 [Dreissena polymorpha]
MGELSMMLNNTGISMNKVVALHGSKSSKTKLPETHTNQGTESKLSPIAKKSPPKSSQLPIMKGSSLNRSFPKVGDSESSMLKSKRLRKGSSCDSRFKSGSVGDSAPEVDRPSDVSSAEKTPKNTSPRSSNQSENDLWSSPNSSSYCANNTGLFDRLDEFKISFNSGAAQQHPNLKTVEDREKTPPADGEDRKANISTNILMSKPKPKSMDEEKATKTNLVNSVNSNPTIKQISDRENLGREYSHEVLDRIYSADAHGSFQCIEQTQLDDHFTALHSRESLETEWNTIRRETVDTTRGDFSRISDIQIGLVPPPTAQSTPFPPSIAKFTDFSTTISSSKVCPVDAPPALKFREACCVGISRKELLPLRNPTDRWMECFIEPKFLECDGKRMSLEHFPFELRQRKFIIDPHKTFNVDVMFLPKRPGAYVAQVQVFSLSFLNRSQMKERDVVPVNISFQASAEDPWIKVSCDDGQCNSVDFGELLWGSCGEKTICIQNMGQATVPLRLAITSNKAWHCFAFEPEGGVSDVSIISGCHPPTSGQGRSIINISLPGCDQPFSYQKVKVWCRPPEKQFTKALARQPPEVFECSVDIEVDTPCSRQPKLSTLHLKATVGVCKLHTQTNLKEIHIRSSPKASERTTVRLFNAGNLSLTVSFGISDHRDVFIVSPTSLLLKPHEDGSIVITFKPNLDSMKKFVTLLLMMVQPSGPVFELQIVGEVQEAVPENLQLLCDITTLDFGGVALGKTCVKCYRLKNNNPTPVLLTAKVTDSDIRLAREADRRVEGSDTLDLEVSPTHTLPVYVMYAPLLRQHLRSKVTMRHPASGKYTVKIQGYGGVSRLHCKEDCLETTFVEGHTCFTVTSFSMDKVKDIFLTNLGDRAARVHVAVYEDLKCTECLLSGEIIVKPSELSLMDGESKKMKLVVGMKEAEFTRRQEQNSVGAALCFEYVDQVESNHPFRSKLIVGLVRGFAASGTPTTTTPLRSVRPYRPSYFSEIATDLSSRFSTTSDDMTERFSHGTESSVVERIGGWSVKPSKLVIYCSNRGQEFETFYIYNHNSVGIRFEMFWPGGNLSLTPGSGTILPRENQCIRVYPTTVTTQSPPWSGQIIVSVDRQTESILVEVKQDASATNQDIPEKDNRSLVPISSNVNLSSVGTNRLGHLEVSRTSVQFPSTRIGKCSEQTIDISNIGPETLRWLFSSFAPLYMKRKTESSKDVFRVSYKVFDFTKQFGKLNAKETLQLTVQFMPQSAGTFTQYWDLQTSSNAGLSKSTSTTQHPQHQDYIMVHLTGEGQEDDTETPRGKSDVENLLPKLPSNKYSLRLGQELMEFPCMERGNRSMLRLELKNNHMEDVKVEVTAPQPPFHVNHSSFKIQKKKYLRLPIEFQPTRPGRFTDVVKFQSSKGDNLILQLSAECRSTHLTSLS